MLQKAANERLHPTSELRLAQKVLHVHFIVKEPRVGTELAVVASSFGDFLESGSEVVLAREVETVPIEESLEHVDVLLVLQLPFFPVAQRQEIELRGQVANFVQNVRSEFGLFDHNQVLLVLELDHAVDRVDPGGLSCAFVGLV
jgi:hypothetical protein